MAEIITAMDAGYEHVFISTNGIRLHAVQAGPENGPLVILLHGFPEFWYGWRKQIGPLAEAGFRVLAPDMRGYNLSDKPLGLDAYRLDVLAGDVAGLMDALGRSKASVVGHDWGGLVAWGVAAYHPQRLERLAILNAPYPGVVMQTALRHPSQFLRSLNVYFFQLPWLPEAILRNNNWELEVNAMKATSRPGTFSDEDFQRYRHAWWRRGAFTSMINYYQAMLRRPVRLPARLPLSAPALILWGAQDFALVRQGAELSAAALPDARLVFLEEASHWVHLEEAGRVNALLTDFLSGK